MQYVGMRYDSTDIRNIIAEMAKKNDVPVVVLRPDAIHVWEYDNEGNILKSHAPQSEMTRDGRRLYCYPEDAAQENRWICFIYNEYNRIVANGIQVFPR